MHASGCAALPLIGEPRRALPKRRSYSEAKGPTTAVCIWRAGRARSSGSDREANRLFEDATRIMFNRFIDTARTQRGSRDGHKLTLDLSGPGVVASLVFTLLCTASAAAPAQTPTQSTSGTSPSVLTLPPGAAPLPVEIAFHLFDLQGIDDEAEAFEFSGELKLVWQDARQAFDPAVEGATLKVYSGNYRFNELAPAWYPQVVLANALGMPES